MNGKNSLSENRRLLRLLMGSSLKELIVIALLFYLIIDYPSLLIAANPRDVVINEVA